MIFFGKIVCGVAIIVKKYNFFLNFYLFAFCVSFSFSDALFFPCQFDVSSLVTLACEPSLFLFFVRALFLKLSTTFLIFKIQLLHTVLAFNIEDQKEGLRVQQSNCV